MNKIVELVCILRTKIPTKTVHDASRFALHHPWKHTIWGVVCLIKPGVFVGVFFFFFFSILAYNNSTSTSYLFSSSPPVHLWEMKLQSDSTVL